MRITRIIFRIATSFVLLTYGLLGSVDAASVSKREPHQISESAQRALEYFLRVDCAFPSIRPGYRLPSPNFNRPNPLEAILTYKIELEPKLVEILRNGPDQETLDDFNTLLEEAWVRRQNSLFTIPMLGLTKEQIRAARQLTREAYFRERRLSLIQKYRENAAFGLTAIGSPRAQAALAEVSKKRDSAALRSSIQVMRQRVNKSSKQ